MIEPKFGHHAINFGGAHIDTWGAGPFTIRVGRRRYYFTDSDMFGPLLESRDGRVLDRHPVSEKHPFWAAHYMWVRGGRKGKKLGRWIVCQWRAPRLPTMAAIPPAFGPLAPICMANAKAPAFLRGPLLLI